MSLNREILLTDIDTSMTEEDKYYTPDPSEFHVGFEFEYNQIGTGWIKVVQEAKSPDYIVGADKLTWAEVADRYPKSLRVPYLDGDGVMAFGFEIANDEGNTYKSLKKMRGLGTGDDRTLFVQQEVFKTPSGETRINSWIWWQENRGTEITVFEGSLKSKAEFRKILKQIHANTITTEQ